MTAFLKGLARSSSGIYLWHLLIHRTEVEQNFDEDQIWCHHSAQRNTEWLKEDIIKELPEGEKFTRTNRPFVEPYQHNVDENPKPRTSGLLGPVYIKIIN